MGETGFGLRLDFTFKKNLTDEKKTKFETIRCNKKKNPGRGFFFKTELVTTTTKKETELKKEKKSRTNMSVIVRKIVIHTEWHSLIFNILVKTMKFLHYNNSAPEARFVQKCQNSKFERSQFFCIREDFRDRIDGSFCYARFARKVLPHSYKS